jgi:hypothetical protein
VPDLCSYLQADILTSTYGSTGNYPNGTVIDARGLAYGVMSGPQIACSVDPFGALTGPPPSTTILLPGGIIKAAATWNVPNNTRIIGDEQGTQIAALSGFTGAYIIEMGGPNALGHDLCPSSGCTFVGLAHLLLDGENNSSVGGIDNKYSQNGSYVKDVNLHQIGGAGLYLEAPASGIPGATNSGPYSNITFSAYSSAACGSTGCPKCIDIETQTQGVHGVTCLGNNQTWVQDSSGNYHAAIYVNASNNSIEDVHIEEFWDGVEIGTTGTVANVLVSNVNGTTTGAMMCCFTRNTVHLCGTQAYNSGTFGKCPSSGTVQDVTIIHVMNSSAPPTTTVADDVTRNAIVSCSNSSGTTGCARPLSTAIYALGEPDGGPSTAYSMFISSPATPNADYGNSSVIPTWGVGSVPPNTNNCSPSGAIYSQTNATSGSSVYVCTPAGTWHSIP